MGPVPVFYTPQVLRTLSKNSGLTYCVFFPLLLLNATAFHLSPELWNNRVLNDFCTKAVLSNVSLSDDLISVVWTCTCFNATDLDLDSAWEISLANSFVMYFAHTQLESLGIDPDLSASWEIVFLQLAEVSQNGYFSQAFCKQKLCDLESLSDISDRREKNWCLCDPSGKVQMVLFMISSLQRKTLKPWETKSHFLKIPVKHKNIKLEVRSNTWDYMDLTVLSLLRQSWWDHSQWSAALHSLLPRHAIIMVLPVNSEILDYGNVSAAATSLTGKDVHLILKWTAELGYNNHRYNCLSIPSSKCWSLPSSPSIGSARALQLRISWLQSCMYHSWTEGGL